MLLICYMQYNKQDITVSGMESQFMTIIES